MHTFTQTKATSANQLVLYHECVLQNDMQQLQAYVVMDALRLFCYHDLNSFIFWHFAMLVLQ